MSSRGKDNKRPRKLTSELIDSHPLAQRINEWCKNQKGDTVNLPTAISQTALRDKTLGAALRDVNLNTLRSRVKTLQPGGQPTNQVAPQFRGVPTGETDLRLPSDDDDGDGEDDEQENTITSLNPELPPCIRVAQFVEGDQLRGVVLVLAHGSVAACNVECEVSEAGDPCVVIKIKVKDAMFNEAALLHVMNKGKAILLTKKAGGGPAVPTATTYSAGVTAMNTERGVAVNNLLKGVKGDVPNELVIQYDIFVPSPAVSDSFIITPSVDGTTGAGVWICEFVMSATTKTASHNYNENLRPEGSS